MKIDVLVYKFKDEDDFFILEIPKEIIELGYESKVYWFDSMIFSKNIDNPLKRYTDGVYKLECETYDLDLTYEDIKRNADNYLWHCFDIRSLKSMKLT